MNALLRLWHQFWSDFLTDLAAINRAATANHRQQNKAPHFNPHQHKKLKGYQKK